MPPAAAATTTTDDDGKKNSRKMKKKDNHGDSTSSSPPPPPPAAANSPPRLAPFANDPVRTTSTLPVNLEQIAALDGRNFLSTALVDYILQQALKDSISPDVLIGSSNSMSFFEMANSKAKKEAASQEERSVSRMRESYLPYSNTRFRFLAATCTHSHFFVVDITCNFHNPNMFENVTVYDSLRKMSRRDRGRRITPHTKAAQFLRNFQVFLAQYCLFQDTERCRLLMEEKPDLLVNTCTVAPCPQQQNDHDCALFAFAVLIHLAHGLEITDNVFTQNEISNFRKLLHQHLLSKKAATKRARHRLVLGQAPPLASINALVSLCFPRIPTTPTATTNEEDQIEKSLSSAEGRGGEEPADNQMSSSEGRKEPEKTDEDLVFQQMFTTKENDDELVYTSTDEICVQIMNYENVSGIRLVIKKGCGDARTYACSSHVPCCFKAKFGPKRGKTNHIVLKRNMSVLAHNSGVTPRTTASDGRKLKQRPRIKALASIQKVASVKEGQPTTDDVMKASDNLEGYAATYDQSFRAFLTTKSHDFTRTKRSFEFILPYVDKFNQLNPNSMTRVEKNPGTECLKRVFVCPGIMDRSLSYVRPIMSLDAAHLTSQWKGTLYVASVKTACDEIYPVALAVMEQNEDFDGWRWFLENLREALPTLVIPHPRAEVTTKYFTFVCERQKGVLEALQQVFPDNLSCFCAIHIARNVQMKHGGKKMAKYIFPLARTFSPTLAEDLLAKMSLDTRTYVEGIPSNRWRNTAWLEDTTLPPRYGVLTSNMSEATNAIFNNARDCSWLNCINVILTTMVERIAILRETQEGKSGVVENVVGILKKRWESTAQYKVVQVEEQQQIFSVFHKQHHGGVGFKRMMVGNWEEESCRCTTLDVKLCRCECGEWQEHGVPCVHAVAYFKEHESLSFEEVLTKVDGLYTYEMEKQLLQRNIMPVCIDRIFPDGITQPPNDALRTRSPGRPAKKRLKMEEKIVGRFLG